MRKIGIIQPNYIPWRGFFDFVKEVDVFVFFDDVQYTTRDWRNRTKIKTIDGKTIWLSVPTIGGRNQHIKDVRIDNSQPWARKHLASIRHNYGKCDHFEEYFEPLSAIYEEKFEFLSELDIVLIKLLSDCLGISTEFVSSSIIPSDGTKDDKLLEIVKYLDGEVYVSGPAAKSYMRPEIWEDAGVSVEYKDYSGYPEYPQISAPFEPAVSVIDLLFAVGKLAPDYIWGRNSLTL